MEKMLYDASLKGDVETLEALMKEDELILARVSISSSCFNQTPLHLASMLGHFEFAKSLISYMPDFASRLDSQGRSPLHLASANGHLRIAKLLLVQDPNMCRVRDEVGRTPLHLAIMNGQIQSVRELIKFNSDLSFHDEEEKLVHLCVIYNRLNILILVIESMAKDFSRVKDENGNTILHSATALKRAEIIKYLVSRSEVDLNGVSGNGLTAMKIIEKMPVDAETTEIKKLLMSAPSASKVAINKIWNKVKSFSLFGAKREMRDESLLVAATVIAAIAYQAAISPPGGVASMDAVAIDDNSTSPYPYQNAYDLEPGTSLLAYFYERLNKYFWVSNTISFMASMSVIFLFVSGASLKRKFFILILRAAMWVTVSAMGFAYVCAASAITPTFGSDIFEAISLALYIWVGFVGLSCLVVVYRFVSYIVRTLKTIKDERAKRKISASPEEATSQTQDADVNVTINSS